MYLKFCFFLKKIAKKTVKVIWKCWLKNDFWVGTKNGKCHDNTCAYSKYYNCIAYGINRCSDNLSGRLTITGNKSTFTGKVKNSLLNIVNVVREF